MNWDKVINTLISEADKCIKQGLLPEGSTLIACAKSLQKGLERPLHNIYCNCSLCIARRQHAEKEKTMRTQSGAEPPKIVMSEFMKGDSPIKQDAGEKLPEPDNKVLRQKIITMLWGAVTPNCVSQSSYGAFADKLIEAVLYEKGLVTRPPEPTKLTPKPYITYKKIGEATYQTCEMRWDEEKGCYTNNIGIGAIFTHKEQAAEYGRSWAMNIDCEFIEPREPSIYSRQSL